MTTGPGHAAPARRPTGRLAFCPVCGCQTEKLVSEVARPDDALCGVRCAAAWCALRILRTSESESVTIADRRRGETEAREPHAPALSELLLGRWRAGDWTVAPEALLARLPRPG